MPEHDSKASSRLAKNTIMLYARTILLMCISLYLTRVVLLALGVEDYGTYNVVGGVVAVITSINGAMSGAASRFISFALGKEDNDKLVEQTFSTIKITHWLLAGIILLISETIGLWFVLEKIVIPEGRDFAVMVCYQCSVLTSLISIISVPYNATIIGHERMGAFAYISIIEAVLRLAVAFLVLYVSVDKLILYSILICLSQILVRMCYTVYCKRNFVETKAKLQWNKQLFREIASFAGWTFNGQLAVLGYTQGINILMNIFFGPVVNAARGVTAQIQNAAKILVNNFQIAIRPQMIKTWASGDVAGMHRIVIYSTKLSFFLTAFTVFPLLYSVAPILGLWLKEVPDHTIAFSRIILYSMLADAFAHGMIVSIHATGDIKKFQLWEGTSLLTIVPIAYVLLKYFSITAEQVMWVYFFVQIFTQVIRMIITLPMISMSWRSYISNVFPRILFVLVLLLIPTLFFQLPTDVQLTTIFLVTTGSLVYISAVIYIIGLNKAERSLINQYFSKILHKR